MQIQWIHCRPLPSFTSSSLWPQMSDKGLWAETKCARPAPACVHQADCRQRENIAEAVDWAHWSQPTNRSHWKNKVLSITSPKSHISLCISDTLAVVLLLSFFFFFLVAARSRILTHRNEFDRFCFKPQAKTQSLQASPCQPVSCVRLQLNVCRQYNPNYPPCCMFYKPCHPHINNSSILPRLHSRCRLHGVCHMSQTVGPGKVCVAHTVMKC